MLVNERGHTKLFYELFYYNMTWIPGPACYKIYSGLHLILMRKFFVVKMYHILYFLKSDSK